jgi:hypothetical protein
MSRGHAEESVPARKMFDFVVAIVSLKAFVKFVSRQKVHEPGKDGFASILESSPSLMMKKYDSSGSLYRK